VTARAKRKTPAPAATAEDVLEQMPAARRAELARVRSVVRRALPKGYQEAVHKGMIVYEVPFERYGDTYNGQALWYAALAAQKNYLTLHLMGAYGSPALRDRLVAGFKAAGKKLDMGKACIRFRAADDLALDVISEVVAAVPLDRWVALATAARRR
jgi:hypothetical protein